MLEKALGLEPIPMAKYCVMGRRSRNGRLSRNTLSGERRKGEVICLPDGFSINLVSSLMEV